MNLEIYLYENISSFFGWRAPNTGVSNGRYFTSSKSIFFMAKSRDL